MNLMLKCGSNGILLLIYELKCGLHAIYAMKCGANARKQKKTKKISQLCRWLAVGKLTKSLPTVSRRQNPFPVF
jgi:hypothetical protein